MINPLTPWVDCTFVAMDLETTGKYPLEAEICEIAGLKWRGGKVIEEFQSLVRPTRPMSDFVISIHNITNEMAATAPGIGEVLPKFHEFLKGAVPVAHHAPFDMGFLAADFERFGLPLLEESSLCTAVISRKAIPESPNHRLQTLVQQLKLPSFEAHRAAGDARACLDVALKCFARIGEQAKLEDLRRYQGPVMSWDKYSIEALCEQTAFLNLVTAIRQGRRVELVYQGGSQPNRPRELVPIGLVRNPNGDFLVAREPAEEQTKRFFLGQITACRAMD